MNASELSQRLAQRADDIAALLLPNGKRVASEWKAGSVDGDAGQSLSVCIAGTKAGTWKDFATGDGGDLLDLWSACRGMSIAEAMADAKAHLGIRDDMPQRQAKEYRKPPQRPSNVPTEPVYRWFAGRGLDVATVQAFQVYGASRDGQHFACFPYIREGECVNVKSRNIADKRNMRQFGGAEPCLFGWHVIPGNARRVAICEGELDAMTLHQCGIDALSVNAGAGNHQWIESDYERLERFDEIFVCFDADDAGRKGAAEVVKRLGAERCRLVTFGTHKDANEALQAGFTADQFAAAIACAKTQDPDELQPIGAFEQDILDLFYPNPDAQRDPQLVIAGMVFEWLEFRPAESSLWTGINGHGKSLMLSQVLLGLMNQGQRVMVYSGEMTAPRKGKRFVKLLTGLDRATPEYIRAAIDWLDDRLWVFNVVGTAKLDRLLEVFAYGARRYGMTHFVIDSLMMTDVPADGPAALSAQAEAMQKIAAFKVAHNVHVHLVAHPRKAQDESQPPGKLDVANGAVISNMADNVLSVWSANKDASAPPTDDHDAQLKLLKQRHGDIQHYTLRLYFARGANAYCANARRVPQRMVEFEGAPRHADTDAPY